MSKNSNGGSLGRVGRYELLELLGRGATADVHRAQDPDNKQEIALKLFHPGLWERESFRKRALGEFRSVAQLEHPNIVRVYEALFESERPAVAMELIRGHSLEDFQPRLPYVLPECAVRVMIDVLKALEHAHARGLIHRDLKPANILVENSGRVVVSDFGLAKMADASRLTMTGTVLGSPDYMAPEQAQGDVCDPRADLFSAAAILYFLMTGTRPFTRHSPLATLAAVVAVECEPVQRRNPKVSDRLAALLAKGLAKKVDERFASAQDFRVALEEYLQSLDLDGEDFSLPQLIQQGSDFVYESLQRVAARLTLTAEGLAQSSDWEGVLITLTHLGLVAPESAALPRLLARYEEERARARRRKAWLPWSIGASLSIALLFALWWRRPAATQPVTSTTPPPAPVPSLPVSVPAAAPKPVALTEKPKLPPGRVRFELPEGTKVWWNGRPINPKQELRGQTLGQHMLRMERPGAQAIEAEIEVKNGDPVVIRAR